MNIKISSILVLMLALSVPVVSQAKANLTLQFSECFLKYDTMNGETEIILYNIRFMQKTAMSEQRFKELFDLTEFEIKDLAYDSMEAPTAIRVLANTTNFMMNAPVVQLFSNILGEKAEVDLVGGPGNMKMNVVIPMQARMYVADHKTLQVFLNEEKTRIRMVFDLSDFPSQPLEVVIGWKEKETPAEKAENAYQHDADIFRLRHAKYYGELLDEYFQKTGKYPLQGQSEHQNYVHIAALHQQEYAQGGPPYKHDVTDVEVFRKELEEGLGRKVDLKFDPQKVPVEAPNFYIYMVEGDSCFFAVHLYNPQPFANPVAKHYHKVELTNKEPNRRGLWKSDVLMADTAFQAALNEKPAKEGFFLHLEEQYK